jgi:hypothetical protein
MVKGQKYDFERLDKYCKENNVTLLEDYSEIVLTRYYIVKGRCIYDNCQNEFEKKFIHLLDTGAYCKNCIKIVSVKRMKETFLQKYGSENILQMDFIKVKTNPNKFTNDKLVEYCKKHNIQLLEDYSNVHITKKCSIRAKCQTENCNESAVKIFREIEKRGIYCRECTNNIKKNKTEKTCLQKYGVTNSSQSKIVQEKYKQTCLKKYGTEHTFQSENIKEKIKERVLEKYGVEYPTKSEVIKNKIKKTNLAKYGCKNTLHSDKIKEKVKNTMIQRYGVENASQSEEIKNKKKETSLKNWGVEYPSQNNIIKNKTKETNLVNLGVEYPTQSEEVRNKCRQTNIEKYGVEYSWQNSEVKQKIKESNLINHGVEYPSQSEEIKQKIKESNLINFGVEYPSQNEEIKQKIKQTNLNKYGVEYSLQSEEIKKKSKETNIKKYGYEHPFQNPEIMNKVAESSYSKKEYIFPSGRRENIQGYENFALNELIINEKINESDIIVGVKNVPEIFFVDEKNKKHRYYVDIFIPSQNRCIEVKCLYTYERDKTKNLLKEQATKQLGYNFEFWIYDKKGNRITS